MLAKPIFSIGATNRGPVDEVIVTLVNFVVIWITRFLYTQRLDLNEMKEPFPFHQIYHRREQTVFELVAICLYAIAMTYLVIRYPPEAVFVFFIAFSTTKGEC